MSFKRFDTEDIVISSDSITSPAWSNNAIKLETFFTKGSQTGGTSGTYYWNMYNADPEPAISTAAIQFSAAYGNRVGSGSVPYNSTVIGKSPSATVYGQFRTLVNGDEDTNFSFVSASTSVTPDSVYFISVERARFKEKILPGSLSLSLKGKTGGNTLTLTDNSLTSSVDTFTDGGRVYPIYAGSNGVVTSNAIEYGKLFPDLGLIVLSGDQLRKHGHNFVTAIDTGIAPTTANMNSLYRGLNSGSNFTLRSEETLSSNYVFVRARNSEFNYSTNPSNITGSGELRHSIMIDSPQSYVTSVGLYNDNNDLIAISKLSSPLLKDFTKEALIRIKLDY